MFAKIFSQEERFSQLMGLYSEVIVKSASEFKNLVESYNSDPSSVEQKVQRIKELEKEADDITHDAINWLRQTFVVKFDREDILNICTNLDDIIDLMNSCSTRIFLYKIKSLPEKLVLMAGKLESAVKKIAEMLVEVAKNRADESRLLQDSRELKSIEEEGDKLYHQILAELFQRDSEPLFVIKMKEIVEEVEEAFDKCNSVANIIEGIVLKYF